VTNAYGSRSGLNPADVSLLTNREIIEVDQDSIDASRISDTGTAQVFAKTEHSGDGIVGLFNTSTTLTAANDTISTSPSRMGLPKDSRGYELEDLWTAKVSRITPAGRISASVPPEGVTMFRVTPL
jgi:Alpha galactosidase C-terminal beta sandwich domain